MFIDVYGTELDMIAIISELSSKVHLFYDILTADKS